MNDLLDIRVDELKEIELPFRIDLLPARFPNPNELVLNAELKNSL